jgi:hypothetical protein
MLRLGSTPFLGGPRRTPWLPFIWVTGRAEASLSRERFPEERVSDVRPQFEVSGVGGAVTGPVGAPSEPFGTSDRTIKGVMCSSGGWCAMPTRGSGECGTTSGRKKSDLRANQGRTESCACAVRPSWCQVSTWAGLGVGLAFFLKARSIRGNITIEQTTTTEVSSRIRNVVTIRPLSISP